MLPYTHCVHAVKKTVVYSVHEKSFAPKDSISPFRIHVSAALSIFHSIDTLGILSECDNSTFQIPFRPDYPDSTNYESFQTVAVLQNLIKSMNLCGSHARCQYKDDTANIKTQHTKSTHAGSQSEWNLIATTRCRAQKLT